MKSSHMKFTPCNILLICAAVWVSMWVGRALVTGLIPGLVEGHRESISFERTFNQFSGALVRKQYDEAYGQCGTDFHHAMTYDQFVQYYSSLEKQYGPLKSYKTASSHATGQGTPTVWRGVMDAEFVYEKKTLGFEFVLYKEGDRWVLVSIEQL